MVGFGRSSDRLARTPDNHPLHLTGVPMGPATQPPGPTFARCTSVRLAARGLTGVAAGTANSYRSARCGCATARIHGCGAAERYR